LPHRSNRTKATDTGGRGGQSATTDGKIDVSLAMPKERGGAGGAGGSRAV